MTLRLTRQLVHRPGLVVLLGFAAAIGLFTLLLMLPVAGEPGRHTTFREALFTATSAVCVTGLTVVDTPSHWSTFGEVTIMAGVEFGGLGFMTCASLLGLTVLRRLGLRTRLLAAAEIRTVGPGDVVRVVRGVALIGLVVQLAAAALLALRFWAGYHQDIGRAMYEGVFHAVTAYNNAGFALYRDNLIGFAADPWICIPISVAVIIGGLGFPVLLELGRELRTPALWSMHTRLVLLGYAVLLVAGTLAFAAFEWRNPATLGPLDIGGKLLVSAFSGGVQPRTAGFNSVDYADVHETSLLATDILMFIGGGPGGTAGGIKVTTFMVLLLAIVAETRGNPTVDAFGRQIPAAVLRQALAVTLLAVALVIAATLTLLSVADLDLDVVLFEAVSAFATVGLSTGITASLPATGQYVLIGLMFAGRLGPVTVASALALRDRRRLFRYPEERPIVG